MTLHNHISLSAETIWIIIGFIGQSLFFMRFFVQWLASERAGRSVIPNTFWYFSLAGGVTLFAYALWRQDPVFILGQSTGLLIYARNLHFIRKQTEPLADSR
ncbi:MAG: lipid A biosynthesis protein [Micavibrio aeruginosavorus]|uniref:Lipid A biosynthesis protein n=1 Tax=Micavibrio aeruginosavorus TaxID=349221 RepID=A0A2W5N4Y1_9BACT|nr:MAG: lipid A biosynthesis protein [Micavibrio aeruginosavorus]